MPRHARMRWQSLSAAGKHDLRLSHRRLLSQHEFWSR
jgi:hypothetical protein